MADLKVKRMNINVEVSLHDAFKAATASQGTTMTVVLMQYIEEYVDDYGVVPAAPKKKTGRR